MKKLTAVLLTALMLLSVFAGCSKEEKEDPNTLTVNVGMLTPVPFLEGLKEEFPEINFVYEYYHGANQTEYQAQRLSHGEATDIIMHSVIFNKEVAEANLVDLSGYTFLGNFDNALLNSIAKDGCVYQVPGPVSTRCILYSKTFFAEMGWEAPSSFQELLALVSQIRADAPEVTPLAMGMVAPGYPFSIVTVWPNAARWRRQRARPGRRVTWRVTTPWRWASPRALPWWNSSSTRMPSMRKNL